jgi:hypothetical protein
MRREEAERRPATETERGLGYEKQCSEVESLLFVLISHMYTFFLPQKEKFINQWC